jgi:predicted nucleotidyltransferase
LPNARILVFGSRVKRTHHKFSDLDIAIANDDKPVPQEIFEELREVFANSEIVDRVDLSDYSEMSPEFKSI